MDGNVDREFMRLLLNLRNTQTKQKQSIKDGRAYVYNPRTKRDEPRARAAYRLVHGSIPQGHSIHHLDGDTMNDRPDNLIAVRNKDHIVGHALHRRTCEFAQAEGLAEPKAIEIPDCLK